MEKESERETERESERERERERERALVVNGKWAARGSSSRNRVGCAYTKPSDAWNGRLAGWSEGSRS
jgi:hypothetical protein